MTDQPAIDNANCACGLPLDFRPSEAKVMLTAIPDLELEGVLIAKCSCGLVRMRLPEFAGEKGDLLRRHLAEGLRTGISLGYNSPGESPESDPRPKPRRVREGRPLSRPFRPRRK